MMINSYSFLLSFFGSPGALRTIAESVELEMESLNEPGDEEVGRSRMNEGSLF